MKRTFLISDTHFNHDKMPTYCQRPENFTELLIKRWRQVVTPEDMVIHLGDVIIGNRRKITDILAELPGKKILILGNHDRNHSADWWMTQGFDFACQAMKYRNVWLTHEPANSLVGGCDINVHGHLHNFKSTEYKAKPFHRLFAVEYTNYFPVLFDRFLAKPDKFNARIHHNLAN